MNSMKEILKNLQTDKTQIFEVPSPRISKGAGFDSTLNFFFSSGIEKMLVDFGKSCLLAKA